MEKEKRKKWKRLHFEDRKKIEELLSEGNNPREIARQIGVHYATIYTEIRRCPTGHYTAAGAQETL